MQWPKTILDAFDKALDVVPVAGVDRWTVVKTLLDETTRRAIWRAGHQPANASAALRMPMTPLGSVINESINGLARRLTLGGPAWGEAVDAFHTYVEQNAEVVFAAFGRQTDGYDHDVGFGEIAPAAEE